MLLAEVVATGGEMLVDQTEGKPVRLNLNSKFQLCALVCNFLSFLYAASFSLAFTLNFCYCSCCLSFITFSYGMAEVFVVVKLSLFDITNKKSVM